MSVASEHEKAPRVFRSSSEAADYLYAKLGSDLRIATPLGLGKPNVLLNEIYRRAVIAPSLKLVIHTALSLGLPYPTEELARRLLLPFRKRHWGEDYPELEYVRALARGELPSNIHIHEFYFQAGAALHSDRLQQDYQSVNYTHVAESILAGGVGAIVQLIAKEGERYSLACNPDLTLDVVDLYRKQGRELRVIGVIHPDLPFLEGEAEVAPSFFDAIVDEEASRHELFALPTSPVDEIDHAIGFRASHQIKDGGTLQIGIGSLSDALVSSLILRHENPIAYRAALSALASREDLSLPTEAGVFEEGLYGLSEMVMDGFMHLRRAGILKREVVDEQSGARTFLHGAFFLGSKEFYRWLRGLEGAERRGLRMSRVSKVNDLYDANELLLRRQRRHPRFVNTCMQATLLGGAASETLESGRVISGVGGQYNFVAMAHEIPDARSLLLLRAVRQAHGKRTSNIVWGHGQLTIPRHLRDLIITEYGTADLRGKSDRDCIRAMIAIADSEFQEELLEKAKSNGKIERDYTIPLSQRQNRPERIRNFIARQRQKGCFGRFPFGCDFTPVEQRLVAALGLIQERKASSRFGLVRFLLKAGTDSEKFSAELERLGIPRSGGSFREKVYRRLVVRALGKEALSAETKPSAEQ